MDEIRLLKCIKPYSKSELHPEIGTLPTQK